MSQPNRPTQIALALAALAVISGCPASSDPAPGDLHAPIANGNDSGETAEGVGNGWIEYEEPIGDESEVALKLTPSAPQAGQPVKIEVNAGSVYGRFRGKVWARASQPREDWMAEGDADWQELTETGGLIMDIATEQMVPLGETEELPRDEQPGETYFETDLTFSDAGPAAVDLKFLYDYSGAQPMAFQAWQGEVTE